MARKRTPGKWIRGLRPDMPILEAARHVLERRLWAVEHLLPPAVEKAGEDVEHIHRFRVATRRADAALRAFEPCIKRSKFDKATRRLRRLRQAAGNARICDVHQRLFACMRDSAAEAESRFYDELLAWNATCRKRAQKAVAAAADRHPAGKLASLRSRLIGSLRVRDVIAAPDGAEPAADGAGNGQAPAPRFVDLARTTLPRIASAFRLAGDADLTLLGNLHALRIAGKRLRYALEVFRPCLGEDFTATYDLVKSLQDELGEINDAHEVLLRIADFVAPGEAGVHQARGHDAWRDAAADSLKRFHQQRDERAARFLEHWRAGQWRALRDLFPDAAAGPAPASAAPICQIDTESAGERAKDRAGVADEAVGTASSDGTRA